MSNPSDISRKDRSLFRNSVGRVQPIKQQRHVLDTPRPEPVPRQTEIDYQDALREMAKAPPGVWDVETGDELHYHRPGIQLQVLKKLRRGHYPVQGELDLHGMTTPAAKEALSFFLARCIKMNHRCIRIIHGKGWGSPDGKPVLKNKVNQWLRLRSEVLAFCSARPDDGGTGAVYVLLRRPAR